MIKTKLLKKSKHEGFPWIFEVFIPGIICREIYIGGHKTRKTKEAKKLAIDRFKEIHQGLINRLNNPL